MKEWVTYGFAVLRIVPHVHTGAFVPAGIVLHARTSEFLGVRVVLDVEALRRIAPDTDVEMLAEYLRSCQAIGAGEPAAGPIALSPPSERFHWLTAPRSDIIQCGPVHEGLCESPGRELERLFLELFTGPHPG